MLKKSSISKDQLVFETLLLELSTQFINLSIEQIDSLIEDIQKRVCDFFGYDLSALWQWTTGGPYFMKCTHLYSPPGGPKRPANFNAELAFPWSFKRVMEGQVILVQTEKMPEEAALERETRRYYGIKSTAQFPLISGGGLPFGGVSFANLHQEHITEPDTVKRLQLVAQVFSNALIRKYDYESLCQSEARLALATTAAGAGIWEYDCVTRIFWVTEETRSLFSYDALEQISLERFTNSVYPADLQRVRQALTAAIENGVPIDIEYRIRIGTDQLKWIRSKGQLYANANGESARILGVSIDISGHKHLENELKEQLKTIQSLQKKLEGENLYLREALEKEQGFEQVVGNSQPLKKVFSAARQVAATDATVLLFGETGTGKGVLANAIFKMSSRRDKPFVIVNCAAMPANLIESELFGREKGAFTGAHARQLGRFEIADEGTIFLDEIGELPLALQAKLLRVLQDGEFERLGSARTVKVDVRVIAATARDLYQEVQTNQFRPDLFYRLNVFPITIPPLRQRRQDIALLVQCFIDKFSRKMGKDIQNIPKKCLEKLMQYSWPGNVRELEHLIERSVIISPENSFVLADGFDTISATILPKLCPDDMASIERSHIKEVLCRTKWKIDGPGGAASILDIHPSTLRFRMKKLGIHRPS